MTPALPCRAGLREPRTLVRVGGLMAAAWLGAGPAVAGGGVDGLDGTALSEGVLPPRPELPALVRVEDPDHPDALARSSTGAVLAEPPAQGAWSYEPLPVVDGAVVGQAAVEALNADRWHAAGHTGQGVRVAVFDLGWFGTEEDPRAVGELLTADCWQHPSCEVAMDTRRPRFGYEEGVHGFACAEVVRDVAPDVELFAVRVNGFTTFENAADWAIRHDIDIISMSMSFFNSSFYDGGGVFGPVMERLEAAGVLLVTSAGNSARQHWSGPWLDVDGDGRLDFDGDNALDLALPSGGRRTVFVTWDEFRTCGLSDLDAWILDPEGDVVGRSEDVQSSEGDRCSPVERVSGTIELDGTHQLVVHGERVSAAWLEVDVFTQAGAVVEPRPAYSMVDPAVHPFAFAVGAVRAQDYLLAGPEAFSSQGPARSGVLKPDLVGPNGLSVTAYGAEGFFGTSASTPAVAGAIALVMSRYPELTARQAADRLKGWAWGDGRHDPALGWGKARLPDPDPASESGCGRGLLLAFGGLPLALWAVGRRSRRRPRA